MPKPGKEEIAAKLWTVIAALTDAIGEVEEADSFDGIASLAVSLVETRAQLDRQLLSLRK